MKKKQKQSQTQSSQAPQAPETTLHLPQTEAEKRPVPLPREDRYATSRYLTLPHLDAPEPQVADPASKRPVLNMKMPALQLEPTPIQTSVSLHLSQEDEIKPSPLGEGARRADEGKKPSPLKESARKADEPKPSPSGEGARRADEGTPISPPADTPTPAPEGDEALFAAIDDLIGHSFELPTIRRKAPTPLSVSSAVQQDRNRRSRSEEVPRKTDEAKPSPSKESPRKTDEPKPSPLGEGARRADEGKNPPAAAPTREIPAPSLAAVPEPALDPTPAAEFTDDMLYAAVDAILCYEPFADPTPVKPKKKTNNLPQTPVKPEKRATAAPAAAVQPEKKPADAPQPSVKSADKASDGKAAAPARPVAAPEQTAQDGEAELFASIDRILNRAIFEDTAPSSRTKAPTSEPEAASLASTPDFWADLPLASPDPTKEAFPAPPDLWYDRWEHDALSAVREPHPATEPKPSPSKESAHKKHEAKPSPLGEGVRRADEPKPSPLGKGARRADEPKPSPLGEGARRADEGKNSSSLKEGAHRADEGQNPSPTAQAPNPADAELDALFAPLPPADDAPQLSAPPISALEQLLAMATPIELDQTRTTPVPDLDGIPQIAPMHRGAPSDTPEPDLLADFSARQPVPTPEPPVQETPPAVQKPRKASRLKRARRQPEQRTEPTAQPLRTEQTPAAVPPAEPEPEQLFPPQPVAEPEPAPEPPVEPERVQTPVSEPEPPASPESPARPKPRPVRQKPEKKPQPRPKINKPPAPLQPEEAYRAYGKEFGSLGSRLLIAAVLTALGLFLTLYCQLGWSFLGLLFDGGFAAYVLLILMAATVAVCTNVWKTAVDALTERSFTLDALLLLAAIFTAIDTFWAAHTGRVPLCAVVQVLLCFSMWGKYTELLAKLNSMRVLRTVRDPIGIVEAPDLMKGHRGILRSRGDVEQFMKRFARKPLMERVMAVYAPVAAGLSLVLGVVLSISAKTPLLWTVSLLLCGSVPLAGLMGYSRAFYRLSRRLEDSDAVLCGWHGASVFGGKHTILVSDADIFPRGSLTINGYKIYQGSADRVIGYAAAAIHASESALSPLFDELLEQHNGRHYTVDQFRFYDNGGLGAEINGEIVLVGSGEFMRRMGVHMAPGMKVQQAAYVSVGGELAGVFAIRYTAPEAVRRGLAVIGSNRSFRTTLITRCFLGTPAFLKSKFDIPTGSISYPGTKERLRLSETEHRGGEQGAILAEDSFGGFAEAAAGGKQLCSCGKAALALALGSGLVSFLLMAILAGLGATETASALNLLLYLGIWAIPTVLLTALAERY